MAVYPWPNFKVGPCDFGIQFEVQLSVMRDGRIGSYGLPGYRWVASIRFEPEFEDMQRPAIEAFIVNLEGGAHRFTMHHLARPVPNGTLTGNPTVAAPVIAGATSLQLTNCNGGLKRGDIIGLAGQILMVTADANPTFTNMTVSVKPAVRVAHNSGTPVIWNRPTTTWLPRSSIAGPFPYAQNNVRPGFSWEIVEG